MDIRFVAVLIVFVSSSFLTVLAQKDAKKNKKKGADTKGVSTVISVGNIPPKTPGDSVFKMPSIAEKVKMCRSFIGLFKFYQDTINGNVFLSIQKNQIGKEFIYFGYCENGVLEAGHHKGAFQSNNVFRLRKMYDRIDLVTENTAFYFDPKNPISKASNANISHAVIASLKVIATDSVSGEMLVDANGLLLNESLSQIKPPSFPGMDPFSFNLGSLSKEKTKVLRIRSYPKNTDVLVEYVYDNPAPLNGGSEAVTDARSVSIVFQHSWIEMPDNDYKPRFEDPRIGFFTTNCTDMTSKSATPYRDMIHRWHLEKKNPDAALSEPVEPIVYWIENTTPLEFRETIRNAVLAWNEAFEAAGFKNAIDCKIQPDDADWDAGDIRYNVLRWTSSPNPPFGGYGPSFVNPRTGQILGADIMLEWSFVTNRLRLEKLFTTAGLVPEDSAHVHSHEHYCTLGAHLQLQSLFGKQALLHLLPEDTVVVNEFLKSALYYLVLHETGHTLGLMHNMRASQLHKPNVIHNKEITQKQGLIGSVMDYPAVNINPIKGQQGEFFINKPGPYDKWAIAFGYTPELKDPIAEQQRMKALLARSTEPSLAFGNDADDMRAPGKGTDPRVMIFDISGDVITYSNDRLRLCTQLLKDLKAKFTVADQSYHELRNQYLLLTGEMLNAAQAVSRYVGGVFIERAFVNQPGATKPFTPVSSAEQKRAMQVLKEHIFGPNAFAMNTDLYSYLQPQRRGFNFFNNSEDPKIHERVLLIQTTVLQHLLHINTHRRMIDAKLYGNDYSVFQLVNDLTDIIFTGDGANGPNTFRQKLQFNYLQKLFAICGLDNSVTAYPTQSRAAALAAIRKIQKQLQGQVTGNAEIAAHRNLLLFHIDQALKPKKG
jgi:hypothetical protein